MADGSDYRTQPNFLRTALWLGAFILLAFTLRSVFTVPVAFDDETQRHLFNGNDPYYHWRTTGHVIETGTNMDFDPAINYPEGRDNPNPPLWTWTSAVVAVLFGTLGIGGPDFVGTALNVMVALWGALCVVPIYMITKDLWGRRAGLWAAFFMAISAPHIMRTIWGYADHDAVSMFFILLAFAFIVRAFKSMDNREHVAHWNRMDAVRSGLRDAVARNRNTLVYATLAGVAITACAMSWKGYPYVFGIIALAAFFQLVLDHMRNRDSTVTWLIYAIAIAVGTLLPWLLYYQFQPNQLASTVFPSLYVLYGVVALGLVLVPTRDLPSVLVFPALALAGLLAVLFLKLVQPGIWAAITSGLGYFQQSKLYSTIGEAQRPELGDVAATLGFFTFLLAFWGLFRALRTGIKGDGPSILVAAWAIVAIYMLFRAARFEVNAAPLFAVLLGYALDRIVSFMGTEEVRKRFRSQHGQNPIARSFRSLSWKPVLVAIAIAFFLVLPNAWLGVDAAMPWEYKSERLPGLMDQTRTPQGDFVRTPRLGAFGLSFDDLAGSEDWVSAMAVLAKWDTCRDNATRICEPGTAGFQPIEERPAFIGWWDYGHWAVAMGEHPTVADPFQSHYELSGRFLASESEEEAMRWLTLLLLRGDRITNGGSFSPDVRALVERTDPALTGMTGAWDKDYVLLNASVADGDIYTFYDAVTEATGKSVGYMGVSSRMYPVGGGGIFPAPVYLADKNPDDYIRTQVQVDFPAPVGPKILQVQRYEMVEDRSVKLDKARFTDGTDEYIEYQGYIYPVGKTPLQGFATETGGFYDPSRSEQTTPTARFYSSMYARAFGGNVLPGSAISGQQGVDDNAAGQGLSHWRAIVETTLERSAGENSTFYLRGVVLLAYYQGVQVNGTLVDESNAPMPNYRVTLRDGFGATHDEAVTGPDGTFSIVAPFSVDGDLTFEVLGSAGGVLHRDSGSQFQFSLEDARAGATRDGFTVTVPKGSLQGIVYEEKGNNTVFDEGTDEPVGDADVTLKGGHALSGGHAATTGPDGRYTFPSLPAGDYSLQVSHWPVHTNTTARTVTIPAGGETSSNVALNVRPITVLASFVGADDQGIPGIPMVFTASDGRNQTVGTNETGVARASLPPGTWTITVDHDVTTAEGDEPITTQYRGRGTVTLQRGDMDHQVTVRQEA